MKKLRYLLFLFGLILVCSACKKTRNTELRNDISFSNDTLLVNTILRNIVAKAYNNPDTALQDLKTALSISLKIDYQEGFAHTYFQNGNILYKQNKYQQALDYYTKTIELSERMGNTLLKAKSLERMASVYLTIGDDHLSLKLYYESLPLFEQAKNKEGIAKVYNIIGMSKSSQREFDTAVSYFQKAIRLNEEVDNQTGLIHNKGNLAFMYYEMGNTEKAKETYHDLIPKLTEVGDSINLSVIYYYLSIFSETALQPDSTLFYLRKAMVVSEKLADTSLLVTLYGKIGQIFLNQNKYDSALYLLIKSSKMAKAIGDYGTQKQALKLLITIDTIKGDFNKANARFEDILVASDSVYNQRIRNNMEASELRYENQKKSNLIEIQKIDLVSAKRQKKLLLFLFSFLAFIFLLLVLLIILLKKNNKRKQEILIEKLRINDLKLENIKQSEEINKLKIEKIEKEIKIKENEQVCNALALEQKNELLNLINKKFTEAMQDSGSISISELNGLVNAIKTQVRDSSDTDLFNQKFNRLHQNFFNSLQQAHPNLTKTELKFCAYLKLNLTGNQIAGIQNITQEAIRKTRYRIRKKFNLSPEESLEVYISQF